MILSAAIALAAGLAAASPGEPPAARPLSVLSRVERSEVRLGDPFAYEIEIRHAPGEEYAIAPGLDAPPFRGVGGGCRRDGGGEVVRTTCALRLALFDLGPHDVPELRLAVRTPRGEATLAVPGPLVTGVGIISADAPAGSLALRALAPTVPLRVRSFRLVLWTAGVLAALALALLVWRAWRARAGSAREPAAPEPPGVRLLRRLDALEARGLAARGLGREHVFEVSEIVREWIGAVSGLNALELTTAELTERLAQAGDPRLDLEALRRFGEGADLVKFAKAGAGEAACAAATAFARGLAAATSTPTETVADAAVRPEPFDDAQGKLRAADEAARSRRAPTTARREGGDR